MDNLTITLIVAVSENNAIGKNNKMLWHLPNDFKYFKQKTIEHTVVMGRKTFESIGKILPERRNIIITRDLSFTAEDADTANSVNDVLTYCRDEREIFIIGGADIYKQFLPLAHRVLLTRVHTTIAGDRYFDQLPEDQWELKSQDPQHKDEKHAYDYTFECWEKK